jgi:hypothetical protein
MIKFSNGNKLYRFSTDGNTAKVQVDTTTYFPKDLEFKLSDEQIDKLKDFIEKMLIPHEILSKYRKYIGQKVVYYFSDGDCHIGYLAAILPKDPAYPFGIYQGESGEACLPKDAVDIMFARHIKPLKEDE